MESDGLYNFNQFLEEHESFNFHSSNQDKLIGKTNLQFKHHQCNISPIHNEDTLKTFAMCSPSPFKDTIDFYEQDQPYQYAQFQTSSCNSQSKCMNSILNFEESDHNKTDDKNTVTTISTLNIKSQKTTHESRKRGERKNLKGLRNLSEMVYKIVMEQEMTTYKQVGEHLVSLLNSGQLGPIDEVNSKEKDEQNIKRRVYDALNVFVSAEIFKKNGKFVISDSEVMPQKMEFSQLHNRKESPIILQKEIIRRQMAISQKRKKIQELKHKKQILNAIIKRNRKNKSYQKQKIFFPMVGVTLIKSLPQIIRNETNTKLKIPLNAAAQIFGDMDLIVKVRIDIISQSIEQLIQQMNEDAFETNQSNLERENQETKICLGQRRKILHSL